MLYEAVVYSLFDYISFVLVDNVAKSRLKQAKSESEKTTIWFYESIILIGLCVLVYKLNHCPWVLIAMTLITAVYTQICRVVDFRRLWQKCVELWEAHVHHTDNVKAINEKQKQIEIWRKLSMQAPVSKPVLSRLSDVIFRRNVKKTQAQQNTSAPVFSLVKLFRNPLSAKPQPQNTQPAQPKQVIQQPVQAYQQPVQPVFRPQLIRPMPSAPFSQPAQRFAKLSQAYSQPRQMSPQQNQNFSNAQPQHLQQLPTANRLIQTPKNPMNNWLTNTDLRRRPLRSYQQKKIPFAGSPHSFTDKVMSAFGYSSVDTNKPAGLRNERQNLCFMNCVIQCLSHTPNLVDRLNSELKQELDCSETESVMMGALTNLMSQCKKTKQDRQSSGILDPTVLQEAISWLPNRLVAQPTAQQNQQDAAEFFMWLMETLHNALNKKTLKEKRATGSDLETLEFIYKDLTEARMQGLKAACRAEISQANGLQNETYAEPIQRLSDLEWLTYKRKNNSFIDDMFSGQLVEAFHCLTGNHLTVNTQTFNILPVPIVNQSFNGIVPLEHCFSKFCRIEHLVGTEGLECEMCKKNMNMQSSNMQHLNRRSGPKTPKMNSYLGSVDSAFQSGGLSPTLMSPIPGQTDSVNESGFQDNVFRTSTPVERSRFVVPFPHVRETERRCLLRQLPDCLVIQLLRFSYNPYRQESDKINTPVSVPLKGLDLTNIVYDHVTKREDLTAGQRQQKYDLYAVCLHLGAESTSYGHYVCYCLAENGIWYKFDDELVTEVNMVFEITTREFRENAYMLFYKRAS